MSQPLESYNLINYLRIIDVSILNLLDYIEINDSSFTPDGDKLIINLNAANKRLFEGFIINNINNETYYGKHNILVNSCRPSDNWRNNNNSKNNKNSRIIIKDSSIYIDTIKLNSYVSSIFKKLPTMSAVFSSKFGNKSFKTSVSIQKDLKLIEFEDLDLLDAYAVLGKILSTFGLVNKDIINYNIICDGNYDVSHSLVSMSDELYDRARLMLIKKGII